MSHVIKYTKIKQFRGCGQHGYVGLGGTTVAKHEGRPKWDPWCLKCNPLPSPEGFPLSPGQKEAKRLKRQGA